MERNAGWLAGRVLVASVFIAMGSYRLLAWAGGEAIGSAAADRQHGRTARWAC